MMERRHDIDWLRMIAIGLLVIYHIAIIFQPWAMFIGFIRSDEPMESLWIPMTLLNVWRIPLLFFVSGMGVYFALQKRTWRQLITERAKRILLPFVFGILAITPLHMLIFQAYYKLPLSYYPHMGHLWFLGNIFTYVLLLSPLFYMLKRMNKSRVEDAISRIMRNPFGPLSLISFFMIIEVVIVKPQVFAMYAETWHGYFLGLLAFLFGFLLVYSGDRFWQLVSKWRWLYAILALVLFTVRWVVFDLNAPNYLMAIESNCWIFGIFGFGYMHLNRPGKLLRSLSTAAYPVYIIHMFVLYGVAALILPLDIPVVLQFILTVSLSGLLCYLIYEFVIKRVNMLRPLFGLKSRSVPSKKLIVRPESA